MKIHYRRHTAKLLYCVALVALLSAITIVCTDGYNMSNQVMGIGTFGVIVTLLAVSIDPRLEG